MGFLKNRTGPSYAAKRSPCPDAQRCDSKSSTCPARCASKPGAKSSRGGRKEVSINGLYVGICGRFPGDFETWIDNTKIQKMY